MLTFIRNIMVIGIFVVDIIWDRILILLFKLMIMRWDVIVLVIGQTLTCCHIRCCRFCMKWRAALHVWHVFIMFLIARLTKNIDCHNNTYEGNLQKLLKNRYNLAHKWSTQGGHYERIGAFGLTGKFIFRCQKITLLKFH